MQLAVYSVCLLIAAVSALLLRAGLAAVRRDLGWRGARALLILAIVIAGVVGAQIADEVRERESHAYDQWLAELLLVRRPPVVMAFRAITRLGDAPVVLTIALITIVWLRSRGDRAGAWTVAVVSLVTELANVGAKQLFARPRPSLEDAVLRLHTHSFPSGHAMAAAGVLGISAYAIARRLPGHGGIVGVLAVVLIGAIGLSRLALGVHWATDVAAGLALGACLTLAGAVFLERGLERGLERESERADQPST